MSLFLSDEFWRGWSATTESHGAQQARTEGAAVQTVELVLGVDVSLTRLCLKNDMCSALCKKQSSAQTAELSQPRHSPLPCCSAFTTFPHEYLLEDLTYAHLNVYLGVSVPLVCRTDVLTVPSPLGVFSFFFFFSFLQFKSPGYFSTVNIFLTVSDMNKSFSSPPPSLLFKERR